MLDTARAAVEAATKAGAGYSDARLVTEESESLTVKNQEMEGIDRRELSKLHGELIAFDWIEQNSGRDSKTGNILASLYRITSQGVRDIYHV